MASGSSPAPCRETTGVCPRATSPPSLYHSVAPSPPLSSSEMISFLSFSRSFSHSISFPLLVLATSRQSHSPLSLSVSVSLSFSLLLSCSFFPLFPLHFSLPPSPSRYSLCSPSLCLSFSLPISAILALRAKCWLKSRKRVVGSAALFLSGRPNISHDLCADTHRRPLAYTSSSLPAHTDTA